MQRVNDYFTCTRVCKKTQDTEAFTPLSMVRAMRRCVALATAGFAGFGCIVLVWRRLAAHAVHRRYRQLVEIKRRELESRLTRARDAGLAWDGCLKWTAAHRVRTKLRQPFGSELANQFIEPIELLNMTATELLGAMSIGRLSAEYVMRCFIARAIEVDETLRAVTEQAYEEALAEAKACDLERAEGKLRGPLHGLPFSVKEQIRMAGFQSTCGACCRLAEAPSEETALLVTLAKQAGAIPFARTNVPQLLMLPETFNAIYGTTCNPYDLGRSPGGSTGGECALIAARGSPLGLGTDVGGSVRIPAFMTGLCAFKPTVDRLSYKGITVPRRGNRSGQREVRSAPGPIARCVADLELVMHAFCQPAMYAADATIPRMPWDRASVAHRAKGPTAKGPTAKGPTSPSRRGSEGSKPLRFGYFVNDHWFEPAEACKRAVRGTAEALRAAGHEVVEFTPLEMAEAAKLYVALLSADGNFRGFLDGIDGEKLHPNYAFLCQVACVPNWIRPLLSAVMRHALGEPRKADLVLSGAAKTAHEYWQVITRVTAYDGL